MPTRSLGIVERELGFITELALASSSVRAFRMHLLDRLRRTIGWDLGKMQSSPDTFSSFITCAYGWDVASVEAHTMRYMSELEATEIAAITSGQPILDADFMSMARRGRLALYREQMLPYGVSSIATMLWQNQRGLFGVTFARTHGGKFRERDLRLFERLMPAIKLGEAYLGAVATPGKDEPDARFEGWALAVGLSERERAVAELVARGLQNREVAGVLGVSPTTVRNQLASVFRKADVTTRAELAFVSTQANGETDPANDSTRKKLRRS